MQRVAAAGGKACISKLGRALIRLSWLPGTEVSGKDARDVIRCSNMLVDDAPYAILVNMRELRSLSIDARYVFGGDPRVLAAAFLGSGPMDRVLAAGSELARHPTRFFLSESEAITWLLEHLQEA
ncbi:MAG: hypothetical protein JWM61_1651 [Micrococcaceae bacterium]|jgi:hypothetical protein|uniref:DUF7793 family protein n=1 Tax=Arthrobacter cheniae TaxID=1258888 RepID=UPI0011C4464A|nr:hypothetical protein [Arthrobacter cheniae]MCU1632999.1 hypothetical protein [Micrococcaceae bacterium]